MWSRATDIQTYIHKEGNGKFSTMVPLSHIFGFYENLNKVLHGAKNELIMHRADNIDSMVRSSQNNATGTADRIEPGQVNLPKLSWRMRILKSSAKYGLELLSDIKDNNILQVEFLNRQCESFELDNNQRNLDWRLSVSTGSERPRYVMLGFQKARKVNLTVI